jgi:hypothetical protein
VRARVGIDFGRLAERLGPDGAGAEPRDCKWSSGRGPVDPGSRVASAAAQGKEGRFIRGSSGNFIGGSWVHPQPGKCQNGVHQLGVSPLTVEGRDPVTAGRVTSSVPGLARETRYTEWTWPERLERLSERLRTLAKIKALRPKRPDRPPRRRKELRARTPPGVPTRADPDGANREQGH